MSWNERFVKLDSLFSEETPRYKGDEPYHLNNFYGDKIPIRFIPTDKIKHMLLNTKVPKKSYLFKLPFDNIFIDVRLENDKIVIPYGIFIAQTDDEEGDESMREFHIVFAFYFKGFEQEINLIQLRCFNPLEPIKESIYLDTIIDGNTRRLFEETKDAEVFTHIKNNPKWTEWVHQNVIRSLTKEGKSIEEIKKFWEEKKDWYSECIMSDNPEFNYKYWNILNQKQILSFICNYLLFLNSPQVRVIIHSNNPKKFKKLNYNFIVPKSSTIILDNQLKTYVDNYIQIPTGVKFNYLYKFLVRGHFRRLRNKRYKSPKTLWITPYLKGKGITIMKDYILATEKEKLELESQKRGKTN